MRFTDIFSGRYYRVVRGLAENPKRRPMVVTFGAWQETPALDNAPFSINFLEKNDIDFVGIIPGQNCWYQNTEIEAALASMKAAIGGRKAVGYGGSMGGYAVLNFSKILDLSYGLALVPQFSMDPEAVPFETRWQADAQQIKFAFDLIRKSHSFRRFSIVYDHSHPEDSRHAELIRAHFPMSRMLDLRGSGHDPVGFMLSKGVLQDFTLAMLTANDPS